MEKRLSSIDRVKTSLSLLILVAGLGLLDFTQSSLQANVSICQEAESPPKAAHPDTTDSQPEKKAAESATPNSEKSGRQESEESKPDDKKPENKQSDDKQSDDKQSDDNKSSEDENQDEKKKKSADEEKSESESRRFPSFGMGGGDPNKAKSRRSSEMTDLFRPMIASAEASTVQVLDNERQVSLGTVISRDGLILTKASELKGDLKCGLADGRKLAATVVGVHAETDLALLRIDTNDLNPINWGTDAVPGVGQWVVSPIRNKNNDIQIGVVAVRERRINSSSPFIGIGPPQTNEAGSEVGAKIDTLSENAPGFQAGLKIGDIVTKIDDVEIKDWDALRNTLKQYDPKDEVTLTISRDSKELKIKVVLGDREKIEARSSGMPDRSSMQNNMGSQPSQRRKDFPLAFTHDLMLNKTTVGGPIVNLNGQVVGINIARAGRVDSLALPTNSVLPVIEMLKSGELAPAKVNQARLEKIDTELREATEKLRTMADEKAVETKRDIEKARKEELDRAKKEMEKALAELQNRIKDVEGRKESLDKELKAKKDLVKKKSSLEKEKKSLSTGIN